MNTTSETPTGPTEQTYIPALSLRFLTPIFDPVLEFFFSDSQLKSSVADRVQVEPGDRILDLGSGTGTLAVLLAGRQPEAEIHGIDADPQIIDIAREKSSAENIHWHQGYAQRLPFPDDHFDHVVSTLFFHHLAAPDKKAALDEVVRTLKPGGVVHVLDFGTPHTACNRIIGRAVRRFEEIAGNQDGLLPTLMPAVGLTRVAVVERRSSLLGTIELVQAVKPA